MKELSADDDAAFEDVLAGTQHSDSADLYEIEGLREAVERDRFDSLTERLYGSGER